MKKEKPNKKKPEVLFKSEELTIVKIEEKLTKKANDEDIYYEKATIENDNQALTFKMEHLPDGFHEGRKVVLSFTKEQTSIDGET